MFQRLACAKFASQLILKKVTLEGALARCLSSSSKCLDRPSRDYPRNRDHFDRIFEGVDSTLTQTNGLRSSSARYGSSKTPTTPLRLTASEAVLMESLISQAFKTQGQAAADASLRPLFQKGTKSSFNLLDIYESTRRQTRDKTPRVERLFDEVVEMRRTEMEHCSSDFELLQWAIDMFERQKIIEAQVSSQKLEGGRKKQITPPEQDGTSLSELRAYPHLLTSLIGTFRDKYKNPHLASAIFDHAAHLSLMSYICGCTTSTYNEHLTTLWFAFRDIKAITHHVEQMKINGVVFDDRTQRLLDQVLRDASNEADVQSLGRPSVIETWECIDHLERLVGDSKAAAQAHSLGFGGTRPAAGLSGDSSGFLLT